MSYLVPTDVVEKNGHSWRNENEYDHKNNFN